MEQLWLSKFSQLNKYIVYSRHRELQWRVRQILSQTDGLNARAITTAHDMGIKAGTWQWPALPDSIKASYITNINKTFNKTLVEKLWAMDSLVNKISSTIVCCTATVKSITAIRLFFIISNRHRLYRMCVYWICQNIFCMAFIFRRARQVFPFFCFVFIGVRRYALDLQHARGLHNTVRSPFKQL